MFRSSLRVVLAILSLTSALATWGMTRDAVVAASPEVMDVKIDNFSMTPQTVTVHVDTQVRWTNGDDIPHTV
jgi:plastocyanin